MLERHLAVAFLAALVSALPPGASAQVQPSLNSCSTPGLTSAAEQVEAARKTLLSLPLRGTDVSPDAQQSITSIKQALTTFIRSYMGCVSSNPDPADIEKNLLQLVHGFEFKVPTGQVINNDQLPPDFDKYGFELYFRVRVTNAPRLVSITANFSIECGHDTVLLIFAPEGNSWKESLHWQTEPYKTVGGGTMAFDYAISPLDDAGRWYVVVHTISPWCSSTWSDIRYAAFRPTADPLNPQKLLSNSAFMWWGSDDYGKAVADRDEFDLRFHSSSVDGGVHNRVWIRHYRILGNSAKRVQPVAVSPRDFVDEWLISPWSESVAWSSNSSAGLLRQAHQMMSSHEKSNSGLLEYQSVYRCSGKDSYQVEVTEETGKNFDIEHSYYFHIAGDGPFTMTRVTQKPDGTCAGTHWPLRSWLHSP
jgi:hypothetical protein